MFDKSHHVSVYMSWPFEGQSQKTQNEVETFLPWVSEEESSRPTLHFGTTANSTQNVIFQDSCVEGNTRLHPTW